jgi:hypothetical protein
MAADYADFKRGYVYPTVYAYRKWLMAEGRNLSSKQIHFSVRIDLNNKKKG